MANDAGVEPSRLSGTERGRVIEPPSGLIDQISIALMLSPDEQELLTRAGMHDRAMRAVAREIESERLLLLVLCMDAVWLHQRCASRRLFKILI